MDYISVYALRFRTGWIRDRGTGHQHRARLKETNNTQRISKAKVHWKEWTGKIRNVGITRAEKKQEKTKTKERGDQKKHCRLASDGARFGFPTSARRTLVGIILAHTHSAHTRIRLARAHLASRCTAARSGSMIQHSERIDEKTSQSSPTRGQ